MAPLNSCICMPIQIWCSSALWARQHMVGTFATCRRWVLLGGKLGSWWSYLRGMLTPLWQTLLDTWSLLRFPWIILLRPTQILERSSGIQRSWQRSPEYDHSQHQLASPCWKRKCWWHHRVCPEWVADHFLQGVCTLRSPWSGVLLPSSWHLVNMRVGHKGPDHIHYLTGKFLSESAAPGWRSWRWQGSLFFIWQGETSLYKTPIFSWFYKKTGPLL